MKRSILIILLVVSIIASISLFAGCSNNTADDVTKIASEDALSGVGENIFNNVQLLADKYKDRTFGGEHEKEFASDLSDQLNSYGYTMMDMEFSYHNALSDKNEELTSTNVIAKKENEDTDLNVIITTQIDNMYNYEGFGDEGVYNGLYGVGIMLELANNLKDVDLPFDVYFVGLGANSMSHTGAMALVGGEKFFNEFYIKHKRSDTLLMIDLSRPVGGDHMYMYTDEMATVHGDYLYDIAGELDFRAVPRDKQVMNAKISTKQPMNYTHIGIMSTNLFFMSARIPSVNFLSVNWEYNTHGAVAERKGVGNVVGSKRDNFEYLVELVGKDRLVNEMDMVYTVIYKALNDKESFVPTMLESIEKTPKYEIWSSDALYYGLWVGIGLTLIIVAILVTSNLKKKLPSRSVEEFMQDMGMNNAGNMRPPVDPFDEGNNPFDSNDNGQSDPFSDNNNTNNNSSNSKKDDKGDDIFGL